MQIFCCPGPQYLDPAPECFWGLVLSPDQGTVLQTDDAQEGCGALQCLQEQPQPHRHVAEYPEPALTVSGVASLLASSTHCFTRSGRSSARVPRVLVISLLPGSGLSETLRRVPTRCLSWRPDDFVIPLLFPDLAALLQECHVLS